MHAPKVAYLVADAGRARLLVRHASGDYELIGSFLNSPTHRPRRDSRTRVFASVGGARSAVDAKLPFRTRSKLRFARKLVEAVSEGFRSGRFEQCVLAAPPSTLRLIRDRLTPEDRSKILGEVPKDLTKTPEADLRERFDRLASAPLPI